MTNESERNRALDWQTISHNFHVDRELFSLSIPQESWSNPTVREYASAIMQTDTMNLTHWEMGSEYVEEFEVKITIRQRTQNADYILAGIKEILKDQFGAKPTEYPDYLKSKLNAAIGSYGLEVIEMQEKISVSDDEESSQDVWHFPHGQSKRDQEEPYNQYREKYGVENIKYWFTGKSDEEDDGQTLKEYGEMVSVTEWLGIDPSRLSNVSMRRFVTAYTDMVNLRDQFARGEQVPAPGLSPTVSQRYERCKNLADVAIAILTEGFAGNKVDQSSITNKMNSTLVHYGLQVVEDAEMMKYWKMMQPDFVGALQRITETEDPQVVEIISEETEDRVGNILSKIGKLGRKQKVQLLLSLPKDEFEEYKRRRKEGFDDLANYLQENESEDTNPIEQIRINSRLRYTTPRYEVEADIRRRYLDRGADYPLYLDDQFELEDDENGVR